MPKEVSKQNILFHESVQWYHPGVDAGKMTIYDDGRLSFIKADGEVVVEDRLRNFRITNVGWNNGVCFQLKKRSFWTYGQAELLFDQGLASNRSGEELVEFNRKKKLFLKVVKSQHAYSYVAWQTVIFILVILGIMTYKTMTAGR